MKCPRCRADNPETVKFCGECGLPLLSTKQHPPVMTETLRTPIKELTRGTVFARRFEVIEELGKGGMGKVYRVFDKKTEEEIALKLVKPEIAVDQEVIDRFRNELKMSRKISHRNVNRMYDLGDEEGTYYITMEYVPGEDLKSFIHRSKQLNTGTAISIAKQVAEGLEEAHRLGVVHRDLKPSNIMIDKEGNAKIMDFGIARSLSGKGITGAGVMIGTPEYMSPEQVEGQDVDQRSDIYSLGVVLYEMVTGRRPFEGETPLSVAHKQKYEPPEDPRRLNAQLPDDLGRLIMKCLEKDKAKRYQKVEVIRADLEKIEQGLPTTELKVPEKTSATSREITLKLTPKKFLVPGLVFLALIGVGIFVWRVLPLKKPGPVPFASGQPALAVLYFENKSGDKKLDFWRFALPELLITDLSQSKYIRVVSSDQLLTILRRIGLAEAQEYSSEDIGKIADQARATHVLRGSFIKAGESVVITAGLQRPGADESPTTLRLEARNENEIIPKVDELTRKVKEGLNLTAAQIANDIEKEAGQITTSSPDALKYYIEGRRYQMRLDNEKTIAFMEKAIEIDPEFAMAYRALATAYGNVAVRRECNKKALELSARLPENERLLIQGQSFWFDEDYARAIEVFEKLVKAYPGYMMGHFWSALSYGAAGDIDKAIQSQELVVQNWRTAIWVGNLAGYYTDKGLYQKAEDVGRSFLQEVEDNWYVRDTLRKTYLLRRQFDLALGEAEKLSLLGPDHLFRIGEVLLLKGDIGAAEKIFQQVYEKDQANGFSLLVRLALLRGKFGEVVSLGQQNQERSKGDKAKEASALGRLALMLNTAGRYEEAYKAGEQYLQLSAEGRKSSGESGLRYLPSQQKSDLFWRGIFQAGIRSFDEANKTAEELKSLIDKGINTKELRQYEYILGLIESGKKNYRQAADYFRRAYGRLDIESVNTLDLALYLEGLARALFDSGDLDKARQEYEKITLLTIGRLNYGHIYAEAYYRLGKIAEKQGDKARARENYRKFLELWKDADPGRPEVEDARKRLAALGP